MTGRRGLMAHQARLDGVVALLAVALVAGAAGGLATRELDVQAARV